MFSIGSPKGIEWGQFKAVIVLTIKEAEWKKKIPTEFIHTRTESFRELVDNLERRKKALDKKGFDIPLVFIFDAGSLYKEEYLQCFLQAGSLADVVSKVVVAKPDDIKDQKFLNGIQELHRRYFNKLVIDNSNKTSTFL